MPVQQTKKSKLNNKGFSLVEVIIAIVVLAVIVLPIVNSIITSVQTNAKARRQMRLTAYAQNLMETKITPLSSADLEEVAGSYDDSTEIEDEASVKWHKIVINEGDADKVTGYEQRFKKKIGNKEYDVKLTLDGSDYATNGEEVVQISNMDMSKDACFSEPAPTDERWKQDGKTVIEQLNCTENDLSRIITITLDKKVKRQTASITYEYKNTKNNSVKPIENYKIFDNSMSGSDLRNVYLFYRPLKSSPKLSEDAIKDAITIRNPLGLNVNVYLIRQAGENEATAYYTRLKVYENQQNDTQSAMSIRSNKIGNKYTMKYYYGESLKDVFPEANTVLPIEELTGNQAGMRMFEVTLEIYETDGENPFDPSKKVFTMSGNKGC